MKINEKIDYTYTDLKNYLVKRFKTKKSGEEFTMQDIQGYARRGMLPRTYGGHLIKVFKEESFQITILRIDKLPKP